MNIFEQEDLIKGLPDQALMQEAQRPSGQLPQYLVVSEIQRRQDMRKRFSKLEDQPAQGTVKEQILRGGIADIGQQLSGQPPQQGPGMPPPQGGMPPQGPMPQQMGMPPQSPMGMPQQPPMPMPQQMPMPPQPPMGMPPQGMAAGGVIRMYAGQQTSPTVGDLELTANQLENLAAPISTAELARSHPLYGNSAITQALYPEQEESSGMTMAEISAANAAGKPHPIYGDSAISQLFNKAGQAATVFPTTEDLLAMAEEQSGENKAQQEYFAGQEALELDRSPLPFKSGLLLDRDAIFANRDQQREGLLKLATPNNNQAIVTDAGKAGSSTEATELDEELIKAGVSERGANQKVDEDLGKGKSDSLVNYESLIKQLSGQDVIGAVNLPDYSGALKTLGESKGVSDALKTNTSGFADLIKQFEKPSTDFTSLKPDYSRLITEAERRAAKIKEDAKRDAGAYALMELGAGLAEGSVSSGLRGASRVSSEIMKQARSEASAESQLARRMEMAGKEAQMNLALKGQEVALADYDRKVGLAARDYGDQRAREFQAAGMDADAAVAKAGIEMKAADALYAKDKDRRDSAMDAIVKQATILRYQDLEKQSGRALDRQIIQMVQEPIRTAIDNWKFDHPNATPQQIGEAVQAIAGRFLTLDVAGGQELLTGSMPGQAGLGAVSFDSLVNGTR
jgi:hypothetical protein